ncbi:MAG: hypothetical protein JO097_03955, partial [Acidobacteriaceae bacterium]|nr:hypothetical protein [Acidobacteriaceae bacterium]
MRSKGWTLGLHIGHDRSVAAVRDGVLIGHLAEERMDRVKYSNSDQLPERSFRALTQYLDLDVRDLDAVGISYTNVEIDAIIDQLAEDVHAMIGRRDVEVFGCGHHRAHALSTFYTSGFDQALVLVADGAGDLVDGKLEAESVYLADALGVRLVAQRLQEQSATRMDRRNCFNPQYMDPDDLSKAISLGRKYEQFTHMVGFRRGEAGKLMALASYGQPIIEPEVPDFDGIDFPLAFGDYITVIETLRERTGESWHAFVRRSARDIAATCQSVVEAYVLRMVNNLAESYDVRQLCLAGGFFLNCLLNHRIMSGTPYSDVHIIPAAGDDGQSVGAAFEAAIQVGVNPMRLPRPTVPYLGLAHSRGEISEALEHFRLPYRRLPEPLLIERMVDTLAAGGTIGLLRGRSEMGPRALCHRSILAHPRYSEIRDDLNRIKGREPFRPFAPVVTAEEQFDYFDLHAPSPYMLFACTVKPEYRDVLAGVTHVDGTARVQAVSAEDEPFVHRLLCEFRQRSGFGVLLNTSFNLAGDPLVEGPHDAITTFLSSSLDALVMEDYYVTSRS